MMRRCMGCMQEYDEQYAVCPYCGYREGTPPRSKSYLAPGTVLQHRYILGKVLGQGGFGITYIAWDQRLEKPVAIKEFFPTAFSARMTGQNEIFCYNEESRQYFKAGLKKLMNESRLLARFDDLQNVVTVLDCIEENGTAYMIMELLRGETVQAILAREGRIPLARTMDVILPILRALDKIHRTGLVHRDVSPDNIFVCRDGTVKLLDFGSARIVSGLDHKTLSVMLKKGFAPIEQYSTHGRQGPFTDVYAVCATTYKMLTGETPESSLDRMANDVLRPISDYISIPRQVEDVLLQGMAVESGERIQSAGELYRRLCDAMESEPYAPADEIEYYGEGDDLPPDGKPPRSDRRKYILTAAVLAGCALALVVLFIVIRHLIPPPNKDDVTTHASYVIESGDWIEPAVTTEPETTEPETEPGIPPELEAYADGLAPENREYEVRLKTETSSINCREAPDLTSDVKKELPNGARISVAYLYNETWAVFLDDETGAYFFLSIYYRNDPGEYRILEPAD
ncbi:MAG: serine/threonine protein kinase [Clostridia bacterium]|nr:serine/threonine protein kinase [Clostridia bacterium]